MNLKGRHFLTLKDFTEDEILYLLDLSAELKAKKEEASAIIKQYVEDFGYSRIIQNGDVKHQVIYTRGCTKFTFNTNKFLKEHPEFDVPEYYEKTKVKSSISFK